MNHINVEDTLIASLIEASDWTKTSHPLGQKTEVLEESVETQEKIEESKEEDITCPMCESVLEEELTDDKIMECVNTIVKVMDNLNENSETEEEDSDEEVAAEAK